MHTFIPEGYKSLLSIYDTQKAISLLKRIFAEVLFHDFCLLLTAA